MLHLSPAIGKPNGIDVKDDVFKNLIARQDEAITRVFTTLAGVSSDLAQFFPRVQNGLPPRISGILANLTAVPPNTSPSPRNLRFYAPA